MLDHAVRRVRVPARRVFRYVLVTCLTIFINYITILVVAQNRSGVAFPTFNTIIFFNNTYAPERAKGVA